MNFVTTKTAADTINTECLILGIFRGKMIGETAKYIDKNSKKSISKLIASGDIKTGLGNTKIINNMEGVKAKRVLIVGLGSQESFGADEFKKSCESAMNSISGIKLNNFANYLIIEKVKSTNNYYKSRYFVEAYFSSIYQFDQLKTGKKNKISTPAKIIMGISNSGDSEKIKLGCEHARSISVGVNIAKDLGNLPANICTPTYLANQSKKFAKRYKKMSVKILNEGTLKKLKMNSFLSVTAGSKEPAKMIVMEYKGAQKQRPYVLVGKGVTFDTGGISIKPSAKMDEMKYDMCGAATVIGAICAVAEMKLPINLNVVVPACENRPSS